MNNPFSVILVSSVYILTFRNTEYLPFTKIVDFTRHLFTSILSWWKLLQAYQQKKTRRERLENCVLKFSNEMFRIISNLILLVMGLFLILLLLNVEKKSEINEHSLPLSLTREDAYECQIHFVPRYFLLALFA